MKHPVRPVLLIVAALLLLSLDHGLPNRYVPDDTAVRCALGMARDLGEMGHPRALVPPAGRYTIYPYLLPYIDLGALGATFMVGKLTGRWGGTGAFAEAVFDDPTLAWLPARIVSVLLALLVPLGVYRAARELGRGKGEAALAALLAGSSLLLVQYAHTSRPWAPMAGFGALSLALGLRLVRKPGVLSSVLAFAAAALAGATLQVGLVFLAVPVTALVLTVLCREKRRQPDGDPPRTVPSTLVHGLVGVLAALVVLGALGYPHLVVHGVGTGADHQTAESTLVGEQGGDVGLQIGGQAFDWRFLRGRRWLPTATSWLGYDPVLVVFGLLGLLLLLGERRHRARALLLVVAPAVLWTLLFLLYDGTHVRYLLGAHLFLAIGAARAVRVLAARSRAGALLACAAVALPLVQAARLDLLLGREDTRTLAARELARRLGEHDLIAMDGMGTQYGLPLRPTARTLQRYLDDGARRARGDDQLASVWLTRNERRILEGVDAAGGPAFDLVPIQRYWRYDSYYPTDFLLADADLALADWMDDWEVDVYLQVDRLPDDRRRQPVTDLTSSRGRLFWEVSPTGASGPRHAELPTDMAFPLTQLWSYERPGPWIRAWRLTSPEDQG